jgi:hypothetical protein
MPFRYLRDPLFLFCLALYVANRYVFKRIWDDGFVHAHLNDLICMPLWVPIMLFVQRQLGLREDDAPPRAGEIVIPLVLWSWIFEVILPHTDLMRQHCIADPWDIVYYTLGALIAVIFWRSHYRNELESQSQIR